MAQQPTPVLRSQAEIILIGNMAIYASQAEASDGIPHQWHAFLQAHPNLRSNAGLYGASPCTDDSKIHYLTGIADDGSIAGERLVLQAGEYAVTTVTDPSSLRNTWTWLLRSWLPSSKRRERNAPEFESYASISDTGHPVGPVEIWIPLDPEVGS